MKPSDCWEYYARGGVPMRRLKPWAATLVFEWLESHYLTYHDARAALTAALQESGDSWIRGQRDHWSRMLAAVTDLQSRVTDLQRIHETSLEG